MRIAYFESGGKVRFLVQSRNAELLKALKELLGEVESFSGKDRIGFVATNEEERDSVVEALGKACAMFVRANILVLKFRSLPIYRYSVRNGHPLPVSISLRMDGYFAQPLRTGGILTLYPVKAEVARRESIELDRVGVVSVYGNPGLFSLALGERLKHALERAGFVVTKHRKANMSFVSGKPVFLSDVGVYVYPLIKLDFLPVPVAITVRAGSFVARCPVEEDILRGSVHDALRSRYVDRAKHILFPSVREHMRAYWGFLSLYYENIAFREALQEGLRGGFGLRSVPFFGQLIEASDSGGFYEGVLRAPDRKGFPMELRLRREGKEFPLKEVHLPSVSVFVGFNPERYPAAMLARRIFCTFKWLFCWVKTSLEEVQSNVALAYSSMDYVLTGLGRNGRFGMWVRPFGEPHTVPDDEILRALRVAAWLFRGKRP